MKLEVDLYLAIGILFLELIEDFLDLFVTFEPEDISDLTAGSPFFKVKLNKNFALKDVIVFAKVTSALDSLFLVFLGGFLLFLLYYWLHWWLQVNRLLEVLHSRRVHYRSL